MGAQVFQAEDGHWGLMVDGVIVVEGLSNAAAYRELERRERDPLWVKGDRKNRDQVQSTKTYDGAK